MIHYIRVIRVTAVLGDGDDTSKGKGKGVAVLGAAHPHACPCVPIPLRVVSADARKQLSCDVAMLTIADLTRQKRRR